MAAMAAAGQKERPPSTHEFDWRRHREMELRRRPAMLT